MAFFVGAFFTGAFFAVAFFAVVFVADAVRAVVDEPRTVSRCPAATRVPLRPFSACSRGTVVL